MDCVSKSFLKRVLRSFHRVALGQVIYFQSLSVPVGFLLKENNSYVSYTYYVVPAPRSPWIAVGVSSGMRISFFRERGFRPYHNLRLTVK